MSLVCNKARLAATVASKRARIRMGEMRNRKGEPIHVLYPMGEDLACAQSVRLEGLIACMGPGAVVQVETASEVKP